MRRLLVAVATVVLVVPTQAATATAATAAPPRVHDLAAFQVSGPVHLQWTTPTGIDRVIARIARGRTAPATPGQGRAVPLARIRGSRAALAALAPGAVYSVAVWTQRDGVLSHSTTTTFTTLPGKPHRGLVATLAGIVTDSAGHPLSGSRIYTAGMFLGRPRPMTTPIDGRFRVRVPAGDVFLGADGARAAGGSSDRTGYGNDTRTLILAAGQTIRGIHLVLPAAGALHGTVTDEAGHPLAGVGVTWQPPQPYLQGQSGSSYSVLFDGLSAARTGPNGGYTLKGMPAEAAVPCFAMSGATAYRDRCTTQSYSAGPRRTVTVPPVALASAPGGSVSGVVTTATGGRVRGAYVDLVRVGGYNDAFVDVGHDGHFAVGGLAPGRWHVCGAAAGFESRGLGALPKCIVVSVDAGRQTHAVLRLPLGAGVSGRLLGPSGHGVPNAVISVIPTSHQSQYGGLAAHTDHQGYYTAGGLPTGDYRVCFQGTFSASPGDPTGVDHGCLRRIVHAVAGRNRIGADRTLQRAGAVAGVITDANGNPAPHAVVSLRRTGRGPDIGNGALAGPDGRYVLTDLPPGRYRMCVYDFQALYANRLVCPPGTVTVIRGRTLHHVDASFPAQPTVHVTITDSSGRPLSGVEVVGLRPCSDPYGCPAQPVFGPRNVQVDAFTMTDEHGAADLLATRSGHYAVCALGYYAATPVADSPTGYADKCTGSTFGLTVSPTTPASVTIALDRGAVVTGRVTNGAGAGVRRAQVHVTGSPVDDLAQDPFGFSYQDFGPSPYQDSLTDSHGRYTIHSVQPGHAKVCARRAKGYRDGCLGGTQTLTAGATTTAPNLVLAAGAGSAHVVSPRGARPSRPATQLVILDGQIIGQQPLPGRSAQGGEDQLQFRGPGAQLVLR